MTKIIKTANPKTVIKVTFNLHQVNFFLFQLLIGISDLQKVNLKLIVLSFIKENVTRLSR